MKCNLFIITIFFLIIGCDSGTDQSKSKPEDKSGNKSSQKSSSIEVSSEYTESSSEMNSSNEDFSSSSNQGISSGTLLKSTNIILHDKNGVTGKVLSVYNTQISVYSEKGYMYSINWDGSIPSNAIFYYSDSNCLGKTYAWGISVPMYAKSVFYSKKADKIYIPKDTLSNGTVFYWSDSIKIGSSMYIDSCSNYQKPTKSIGLIELKPTTRKEVGIPETITPPLRIEFE